MTFTRKWILAILASAAFFTGEMIGNWMYSGGDPDFATFQEKIESKIESLAENKDSTLTIVSDDEGGFFPENIPLPVTLQTMPKFIHDGFPGESTYSPIYPVVRIIDGDTVKIDVFGATRTIRLAGVDTPETVHPRKPVEQYGPEASRFLKNLLLGESVWFIRDASAAETDRYGRFIGHLYRYPEGLWVNEEIVRQGYGKAYTKYPCEHTEDFIEMESRAKAASKGLWGDE